MGTAGGGHRENLFVRRLIIPGQSTSISGWYQNFNNFVPFFPRNQKGRLLPSRGDAKLIRSRLAKRRFTRRHEANQPVNPSCIAITVGQRVYIFKIRAYIVEIFDCCSIVIPGYYVRIDYARDSRGTSVTRITSY